MSLVSEIHDTLENGKRFAGRTCGIVNALQGAPLSEYQKELLVELEALATAYHKHVCRLNRVDGIYVTRDEVKEWNK